MQNQISRSTAYLKSLCCVVLVIVVVGSGYSQTTGSDNQSIEFRLRIQTDRRAYSQGDEIPIHVSLTNVSRRNIIVGRDLWLNDSPSRVTLFVTALDGHSFEGLESAVDGIMDFHDLPKSVLSWCISLPPGYSYGSDTSVQSFVDRKGLIPGMYRVKADFESSGIEAQTYFNPLLGNKNELDALRNQDWKGTILSNELNIKINSKSQRSQN